LAILSKQLSCLIYPLWGEKDISVMANITDLVASIEVELEAARNREARAQKTIEITLAEIQQDSRAEATDEENALMKRSFETIDLAKAQQVSIQGKLANARKVQAEAADFDKRMNEATRPEGLPERGDGQRRTASVSVGNEPHTYTPQNDPSGSQFLSDVVRQFVTGDVRSTDRLRRHMNEETVDRAQNGMQLRASDVGTTAFSGLVVPQYLVDLVAPHVANLRPFADLCNKHTLPAQGMSLDISRITTASAVALQTAELAAGGSTAMDDTLLTIAVQTALGEQTISRQAIERGTGISDVVLQDLFRQYNTVLDNTLLNQASTGLTNVAHDNATASAATLAALYPAILGAASQSETATLGMAHPDFALMHPRRWYWLQSLLTTQWPAFTQPGVASDSLAAGANNAAPYNTGVAGVLPSGLRVVTDANILTNGGVGTNEDEVYVVPTMECHLWEDTGQPAYIRAEQPRANNLGVLLVVYGYFGYTFQRYTNATQKVTGAGLAAVTGF
jgi:hypothetical protein